MDIKLFICFFLAVVDAKRCPLSKRPKSRPGSRAVCNTKTGRWKKSGTLSFTIEEGTDDFGLLCPAENINMRGGELRREKGIKSWRECGQICQNDPYCIFWSWVGTESVCVLLDETATQGSAVFSLQISSGSTQCPAYEEVDPNLTDCEAGWVSSEGSCYSLMKDHKDISVCREECERYDDGVSQGHLASVHSLQENQVLSELAASRPLRWGRARRLTWLGARLGGPGGQFSWDDGTPWDYQNFDSAVGEPQRAVGSANENHSCVFLGAYPEEGRVGLWSDGACKVDNKILFDCICKL